MQGLLAVSLSQLIPVFIPSSVQCLAFLYWYIFVLKEQHVISFGVTTHRFSELSLPVNLIVYMSTTVYYDFQAWKQALKLIWSVIINNLFLKSKGIRANVWTDW